MTYCLALSLDEGLVFASDTRTNAGADYVTSYAKTHLFEVAADRTFVLCTAGNLATSQEIVNRIRHDLEVDDGRNTLANLTHMWELANYVGRVSLDVQEWHARGLQRTGADGSATLLFGGQVAGARPEIFMIYPEGNPIASSPETPYLQIGENKYGKPILDRLARSSMTLAEGARLALVSLDATVKSNVTVGPPFDITTYRTDTFTFDTHERIEADSPYYEQLRDTWQTGQRNAFDALPPFPWEPGP